MALCKQRDQLRASSSDAFDKVIRPGTDVVYEGIYRCLNCMVEMAVIAGKPFPGTKHRAHAAGCIEDRWQLLVGLSKG
jgi:hypothetical protein